PAPGSLGSSVPGSFGSPAPGSLGSSVPGSLGSPAPGSLGSSVPGSLGSPVPGSLGSPVPGSPGSSPGIGLEVVNWITVVSYEPSYIDPERLSFTSTTRL